MNNIPETDNKNIRDIWNRIGPVNFKDFNVFLIINSINEEDAPFLIN